MLRLTVAPPCQVLFHVWLEHGTLWQEVLAGHSTRQGADPSGPPPDLPKKLVVRRARALRQGSVPYFNSELNVPHMPL